MYMDDCNSIPYNTLISMFPLKNNFLNIVEGKCRIAHQSGQKYSPLTGRKSLKLNWPHVEIVRVKQESAC